MSAKNTAVNILILTTYVSFLLYRRTGKRADGVVGEARQRWCSSLIFAVAAAIVIFLGVYGYFVEAAVRIGFSVPQVLLGAVRDDRDDRDRRLHVPRAPRSRARPTGASIPPISQYVLIFIAVTFTWLMGLMGYVRSGLRQHWHVYGVDARHLGRRLHADARLRHPGGLGDRADLLRADRLRLLAREPASTKHDGARRPTAEARREACPVPLTRSLALIGGDDRLLHLRRPARAAEGGPAAEGDRAHEGHDHRRDGQGRARGHGGQGLCLTCHTIGKSGALRFPDLAGIGDARRDARARACATSTTWRSRSTSPNAFIVPGFNPACRRSTSRRSASPTKRSWP